MQRLPSSGRNIYSDMKNIRLKDIAIVTSGNSAPQNDKMFEDGIYPFVRTSDVGRVHLSASFTKPEDYLNETGIKGMKLFPKDSILFPKSGASTLLNHRVLLGEDSYVVSHLAVIVPDKSKVVPLYLYYYTTRIDAGELVNDRAYPSLKTSILEQVSLNLPSLAEQERIVTELDLLAGIIDKQKAQLKELDNLAQSIFYDMFGDPVENEKGWEVKTFGEVGTLQRGAGLSKKDLTECGYPCILYGQIHTRFGEFTNSHIACIPTELVHTAKIAHHNDVIMAITSEDVEGSCKSTAWMGDYDIAIGSDAAIYHHTQNGIYVSFYTKTKAFYNEKEKYARGFKVTHISTKEISQIPLPIPPMSLQNSFSQKIQSIESQKAAINRSIAETQKLFDYTMDKYFG